MAQMLKAADHKLYFFSNYSKDDADERMERDFLISKAITTSRHNVSPIEVKSGKNYTLSSMEKFQKKYREMLSTSYILHTSDLKTEGGVTYLPLYMTPLL